MTQSHGRSYEHTLTNGLDSVTPAIVWTTTAGYSGNATADACDMVVTVDPSYRIRGETGQFNIEAKKRRGDDGKRVSNVFAGGASGETGLAECKRFVQATPDWADPILAIKFDHRKLVVINALSVLAALGERKHPIGDSDTIDMLQPRLTPSANISMVKPSLDDWASAQAADDDAVVLARELGLPLAE